MVSKENQKSALKEFIRVFAYVLLTIIGFSVGAFIGLLPVGTKTDGWGPTEAAVMGFLIGSLVGAILVGSLTRKIVSGITHVIFKIFICTTVLLMIGIVYGVLNSRPAKVMITGYSYVGLDKFVYECTQPVKAKFEAGTLTGYVPAKTSDADKYCRAVVKTPGFVSVDGTIYECSQYITGQMVGITTTRLVPDITEANKYCHVIGKVPDASSSN